MAAAGCPALDQAQDTITDTPAGRLPRFRSGAAMRAVSRSLLEERIRHHLGERANVRFLANREVVGLVPGANGSVQGVRVWKRYVSHRHGFARAEEPLAADLVVDTSGQGSRAALAGGFGLRGPRRRGCGREARIRNPVIPGAGGLLG